MLRRSQASADGLRWKVSMAFAVGAHLALAAVVTQRATIASPTSHPPTQPELVWVDAPERPPASDQGAGAEPVPAKADPGSEGRKAGRAAHAKSSATPPRPAGAGGDDLVVPPTTLSATESPAAAPVGVAVAPVGVAATLGGPPGETQPQSGGSGSGVGHGTQSSAAAGIGAGPRAAPRLITATARCSDLFPHDSDASAARVTLDIDVSPAGMARTSRVLGVTPPDRIFDDPARLCARRLRFVPAQDRLGRAVASHAVVRLGFRRN